MSRDRRREAWQLYQKRRKERADAATRFAILVTKSMEAQYDKNGKRPNRLEQKGEG